MNIKQLNQTVQQAREEVESRVLNRKGKTYAKHEAENIFNELGLKYSKGVRETFTHYYLMMEGFDGSISLFISYNTQGKVIQVSTY